MTSQASPSVGAISPLVSTSWLRSNLSAVVPLDASFDYHPIVRIDDEEVLEPDPVHDFSADYLKAHIQVRAPLTY